MEVAERRRSEDSPGRPRRVPGGRQWSGLRRPRATVPRWELASLVVSLLAIAAPGPGLVSPSPAPIAMAIGGRGANDLSSMIGDGFAFDSAQGGELVFGNLGNPGHNQTWFHGPGGWVNETLAEGPTARLDAAMAFDPSIGAVVLFGGRATSSGAWLNDTWEYRQGSWHQLPVTSAPPAWGELEDREMVYDPYLGTLVLVTGTLNFSAGSETTHLSTWSWSGGRWDQLGVQQIPTILLPANGPMLAYDPSGQALVLPDALDPNSSRVEVWSYQSGNWSPTPAGPLPAYATLEAITGDPSEDSVLALGAGWEDSSTLRFSFPTFMGGVVGWTNATSVAGQPHALLTPLFMSYDTNLSQALLFGEIAGSNPSTGPTTWRYALAGWTNPTTPGLNRSVTPSNPNVPPPTSGTGLLTPSLFLPELLAGLAAVEGSAVIAVSIALRRRRIAEELDPPSAG